jgi:hypothetical protein
MGERLLIQRWFDNGGTAEELEAKYAIRMRRGVKHPNVCSFKYDQISSPFAEPIVRECRGIVLDESDNWRVLSRAFDKFFNHGEGLAADIHWPTGRVQEKVDGSLCSLYWYAGAWHCATTGTPDGSGEVNGFGIRFSDLFFRTFDESGLELPSDDPGVCLFFELTSPMNRIVVRHAGASLTLLGGRDMRTMQELSVHDAESLYMRGARRVREYTLHGWDDIEATFLTMDPLEQEGYVVVDGRFNRVKTKHPGYVAMSHMKDGCSPRTFVAIARSGETSEVEAAFPEFRVQINDARARVEAWSAAIDSDYARLKDLQPQKEFALSAVHTKCPSALFTIRAGKARDARDYLRQVHIDRAMEYLGVSASAGAARPHTETSG